MSRSRFVYFTSCVFIILYCNRPIGKPRKQTRRRVGRPKQTGKGKLKTKRKKRQVGRGINKKQIGRGVSKKSKQIGKGKRKTRKQRMTLF